MYSEHSDYFEGWNFEFAGKDVQIYPAKFPKLFYVVSYKTGSGENPTATLMSLSDINFYYRFDINRKSTTYVGYTFTDADERDVFVTPCVDSPDTLTVLTQPPSSNMFVAIHTEARIPSLYGRHIGNACQHVTGISVRT